jgi:hypothetical protein
MLGPRRAVAFVLATALLVLVGVASAAAWTPLPVKDDPLLFMPGSQPGDTQSMDQAGRCENCHSGYNAAVEPGSNWRGSMMAQAARDPLWLACLTVAAQDSIWALGNPNATDICIRCHSPGGWLAGRSDPTNTSALAGTDLDGVQCDFCHRMQDPLMVLGQPDVVAETPGSLGASMADQARAQTYADLGRLRLFSGVSFLAPSSYWPRYYAGGFPGYSETGAGQYFIAQSSGPKWGPRPDTAARHQIQYSRFHKSRDFCHSCHDVSNPILQNLVAGLGTSAGTEQFAAASFFHVERTSSEFLLSAYGRGSGEATNEGFPGVAWAAKCQDCHMRDVSGRAANKNDVPVRDDLALHDLTGGNTWITGILASADSNYAAGYDAYNYRILSGQKYPGASIDVSGISGSGAALARGQRRALEQLEMAATLSEVSETASNVTVRIRNNTGHKLISGFPEGRRMFLSVTWYDAAGAVIGTTNPYEPLVINRDGAGNAVYVSGGTLSAPVDELIFETKMSSSITEQSSTFHFALADDRYKDNRIPPKGFDIGNAAERIAQPRWGGADAYDYFTPAEYAGGYHDVTITKPAGAAGYAAALYYQTTSKEYIEFLRDQVRGSGANLTPKLTEPGADSKSAYVAQTDPFFSKLKGWGDAIWDLWLHNGGSAPVLMTSLNDLPEPPAPPEDMTVDPPSKVAASYNKKAGTMAVSWTAPSTGANGYYVYRSTTAGGPYILRGTTSATSFTDGSPFSPGTYYYVVTAYKVDKLGNEYVSGYSNEASVRIR